MKKITWNDITDKLKSIFSLKRTRITLYIVAVLWVAVAAQIVINRAFHEEIQITEAFVKTDTEEMQSSLELAAEYKSGYLSDASKEEMIQVVADSIGLVIDDEIKVTREKSREEYCFYKQAKHASSEIKVVSIEKTEEDSARIIHYLIVRLNVMDGIKSIEKYKKLLDHELDKLKVSNRQITLKYEGNREGNLSLEQKREVAEQLVKDLQGELAIEYDEGDLYTVYGYTGMLNEYVTSAGNKINIQIAITYNEIANKTTITLATPVLNENW